MEFINDLFLDNVNYENYPFPYTVLDGFLKEDVVENVLCHINELKNENASEVFNIPNSPYEYKKYAFIPDKDEYLKRLFIELNSDVFITYLEKITGIKDIIRNEVRLHGAGIHRIENGGYLQLHTDFNSYYKDGVKLDRRINLLIYMNPDWKEEYGGTLCLCDKEKSVCIKKILPILNRCVIFNTSKKSVHGHPIPLSVPDNIRRQSIAVYYYTKNTNLETGVDFEGDLEHSTLWYPHINCL
jgi:Rps23 Pro-64 3,4-dihydroxylase Tpa1-like proline 4-hydroxylase